MSHLAQQQEKFKANQERVTRMLRITNEDYSVMLFESAFKFIDSMQNSYCQEHLKVISQHFMFWNWWKNQYSIIDERFLNEIENNPESLSLSKLEFENIYKERHKARELFIDKNVVRLILSQHELLHTKA